MNLEQNARIGIWGYGIVGRAAVEYFCNQGYHVNVMDKRELSAKEINFLHKKKCAIFTEKNKDHFFISHDYLFSSPGVNIADDYPTHKNKWLNELDIFVALFDKPIIAVTGSIGKTSITTMLASLLKDANINTCVGGNIGTATFDLLLQKNIVDYALLEVSSFQLEHCSTFAPQLAMWTNLYPNHLDHHKTENDYLLAKYAIMAQQNNNQHALLHFSLRDRIPHANNQQRSYFTTSRPPADVLKQLTENERIYYLDNNTIMRYNNTRIMPLITLTDALSTFSFLENIILLAAAADILNISKNILLQLPHTTQLPEHRLEKVATINSVDFYNDSKSTTTASTLAAVEKLHHRPLHLFLGGLSKGVNRKPFIKQLAKSVKRVYCFGKEADELYQYCVQHAIPAQKFDNLDSGFTECIKRINNDDIVLLSPAGSSYDLYNNFEERGAHFKNLIARYLQNHEK